MAARKPLVINNGVVEQLQAGDTLDAPGGGGGGFTLSRHEIDFGSTPRGGAFFDITISGVTAGQAVLATVSLDMPSGVAADELEMDPLCLAAHAIAADTVRVLAAANAPISGLRAINILR